MKKLILSIGVLAAIVACSSDDSPEKKCNCQKITATYNEEADVFEPIGSEYYSDDCDDRTTVMNENGDGTYYQINCTPAD